jgi:hypothetical protein
MEAVPNLVLRMIALFMQRQKTRKKKCHLTKKECLGEKIMAMHTGNKLCQWCRKMFPKKDVRFYPKASMKMCSNCVEQ